MTNPAITAQPDPPATDPDRYRRAVIPISGELLKVLLGLPPNFDVRHFFPSPDGYTLMAAVTSPDLPEVHPGLVAPGINPTYDLIDGRAVLVETGLDHVPNAARWEWGYRYVDWAAGSAAGPVPERTARTRVAEDHSAILLRRAPGDTEWTEAPA